MKASVSILCEEDETRYLDLGAYHCITYDWGRAVLKAMKIHAGHINNCRWSRTGPRLGNFKGARWREKAQKRCISIPPMYLGNIVCTSIVHVNPRKFLTICYRKYKFYMYIGIQLNHCPNQNSHYCSKYPQS